MTTINLKNIDGYTYMGTLPPDTLLHNVKAKDLTQPSWPTSSGTVVDEPNPFSLTKFGDTTTIDEVMWTNVGKASNHKVEQPASTKEDEET